METYGNNDLKNDNSLNKISKKNISIIALLLILIALIIALILKDPLASTAIATSIFFFIYSFIRSKKKDFLRAIRYTIAIFNFFIITVYPLLFFTLVILFYLSKYYYWHRCNIHYPTFLVDEQTYNPIENSFKKSN